MSARGTTTSSNGAFAKDQDEKLIDHADGDENNLDDNRQNPSSMQPLKRRLKMMMAIAASLLFVLFTIPKTLPGGESFGVRTYAMAICLLFAVGCLLCYCIHLADLDCFGYGTATTAKQTQGQLDDFDAIIAGMANQVMEEGNNGSSSGAAKHPKTQTYHLEETVDEITGKKSRTVVETGHSTGNSRCVLRLHFAEEQMGSNNYANGEMISIHGTRTYIDTSPSEEISKGSCYKRFNIPKGLVSSVTKKAYWEEVLLDTDQHQGMMRRVVVGQFGGDNYASFSGEWLSTDATRGSLVNVDNDNTTAGLFDDDKVKDAGAEPYCPPLDSMV